MYAVFCLDDHGGMTFGGKRQSRDSGLIAHLLRAADGRRVWCAPGSQGLFGEAAVTADVLFLQKAGAGEIAFCETRLPDLTDESVEELWVYRWHRAYPCDRVIVLPDRWHKTRSEQFAGTSHETIEWEVYTR